MNDEKYYDHIIKRKNKEIEKLKEALIKISKFKYSDVPWVATSCEADIAINVLKELNGE